MALQLTATAELLTEKRNISPNLIIDIDGVDTMYSTLVTLKSFNFDEGFYFDAGLFFDGGVPDPMIKDLISFGTTGNTISQQLLQDKGGTSSVSSFAVDLIDKDQEISNLVSPGKVLPDLLGTKAKVWLNFAGGIHPKDSILIHRGIIDEIKPQAASVMINIAHPEAQKRQDIFVKATTKLNGAIDSTQTTITLETTAGLIAPSPGYIESCVKIDNEVIKFTAISGNDLTGCTRGYLSTTNASHSNAADVESIYRLQGNSIDLALRLMLTSSFEYWSSVMPTHIGAFSPSNIDAHVIYFEGFNGKQEFNYVVGDFVTISDSPSNNTTDSAITEIGSDENGSYIKIAATLVPEFNSTALVSFKSKYNTLNEGMDMTPDDVDVDAHETIYQKYFSSLQDYDFYLTDTIKGKDFISNQIYMPSGLYTLPRNARASVGITLPPIAVSELPSITSENVVNISQIKTVRSTNKNFYNAIVYRYNKDLDDKYKKGKIVYSANSQNRIKNVGNKPLTMDADGVRESNSAISIMDINSRRLIDRYQYGSEMIQGVKLFFKDGFKMECGDVVLFGDSAMKLTDVSTGDRNFQQKAYEIVNKSLNIKTAEVTIDLLATGFDLDGRYGSISPSTKLDTGSTTTVLRIQSFMTDSISQEQLKWADFVGEKILVHNEDYSYYHETTFLGFDPGDPWAMLVSALPSSPSVNFIVDIPKYDETNSNTNYKYKLRYVHLNPTVSVTTGTSNTVFNVGAGDAAKFVNGQTVKVRKSDWSSISPEVTISGVSGTQITVDASLGFTPDSTYSIELIGFLDGGKPYRIL